MQAKFPARWSLSRLPGKRRSSRTGDRGQWQRQMARFSTGLLRAMTSSRPAMVQAASDTALKNVQAAEPAEQNSSWYSITAGMTASGETKRNPEHARRAFAVLGIEQPEAGAEAADVQAAAGIAMRATFIGRRGMMA